MFSCLKIKTVQFFKNLFFYLNCFLAPIAFLQIFLMIFIIVLLFHQNILVITSLVSFLILFGAILLITNRLLHATYLEDKLEEYEDKLKEKFNELISGNMDEIVSLHSDVKKCNKPFDKKILKAKVVLIGLNSTYFSITGCTEFNFFTPKRENIKKACAAINKCEFKGMEEYYYTFIERVFYDDDKLFIVTTNRGSTVLECDENSAKKAVKAIRKRLREREDKRQYSYIKEAEMSISTS